ncbi:hypothetical protein [Streptomyces nogalater]|uniref:Uncharacterized protein n=1 Tax=Streptomyces nogalater TaxID=38314 RepID=A0ABW0WIY8_STRNO
MINKSLTVRGAQQHGEGYIPMLLDRLAAVDGHAYEWIAVFLLDHPHIATCQPIDMPAIARTRRDGGLLLDQLRSTTAVLDYLFRAAAEPPVPLVRNRCAITNSPPRMLPHHPRTSPPGPLRT